eukprot:696673-Prymnesium_polylepis.1
MPHPLASVPVNTPSPTGQILWLDTFSSRWLRSGGPSTGESCWECVACLRIGWRAAAGKGA